MPNKFILLFNRLLKLDSLPENEKNKIYDALLKYISHGRTEEINGRTEEYIEKQIKKFIKLLNCIGYNEEEIRTIIVSFPSLLNSIDSLYEKYLFLGLIENDTNTFRKERFKTRARDLIISLDKMYARYRLCCEAGYDKITWNTLTHATDKEFASIFIKNYKGAYQRDYQLFDSYEEVSNYLNSINSADLNIEDIKRLPVNEDLVNKYEEEKRRTM